MAHSIVGPAFMAALDAHARKHDHGLWCMLTLNRIADRAEADMLSHSNELRAMASKQPDLMCHDYTIGAGGVSFRAHPLSDLSIL